MDRSHSPRVLAVGALNIDNLGDLLFLPITEHFLPDAEITPAAPVGWAVSEALLDRPVPAYGPLLDNETYDVIWTLGGQVGGPVVGSLDLEGQFLMSAPAPVRKAFESAPPDERRQMLSRAGGDRPVLSAYVPSPSGFPLNASAATVINSAGLAGLLDNPARRDEHVALLRGTTFVSVRDKESSALLDELGIEHRLAPDAVHTLSTVRPSEPRRDSDIAIFQVSRRILGDLGVDQVAATLARCSNLRGLRIRVLMTGTYIGADSPEDNARLIEHARRVDPGLDIELIEDRKPFDLVDHIRGARIVIGTALHLRIPAASYKIPRVTFTPTRTDALLAGYDRVTMYARHWDPEMPYGVPLAKLDDAIGSALSKADDQDVVRAAERLVRLAEENLKYLADAAMSTTRTSPVSRRRVTATRSGFES